MASCFINPLFILELTEVILIIGIISIAFGLFIKSEKDIGCLEKDSNNNTGVSVKDIYKRFIIMGIIILIIGMLSYIIFQGGARKCFPIYLFFMELFQMLLISGFIILMFGLYKNYQNDYICIKDKEKSRKDANNFMIAGAIFIIMGFIAFFINKYTKKANMNE
jgi:uncharacterized membrane protein YidH (DUF202 family)